MDNPSIEERIRTRAYHLWENAPDPKGTPDEYWEQARTEIQREESGGKSLESGADRDDKA